MSTHSSMEDHNAAHKFSSNHREQLLKDERCGCFYRLEIFSPSEITDWIEDPIDGTANCPHCGIDSVIGEGSVYPITKHFMRKMRDHWFIRPAHLDYKP